MKNKINLLSVAGTVAVSVLATAAFTTRADTSRVPCSVQALDGSAIPSHDIALVHRFNLPEKLAWGKVSIKLDSAGWRVGDVDGPRANPAQMSVALGAMRAIEIGSRCTGWVEGPTAYPCGFAVRELGFSRQTDDRQAAIAMDWTPDPQRAQAAIAARPQADMKGLLAPVLDTPRFVRLLVSAQQFGNLEKAASDKLEFEVRVVSNPLVPSLFDRKSGLVTMCGGGQSRLA